MDCSARKGASQVAGSVVPVSHMVIAHRDWEGRIQHFSAIMRDISEAAQARAALLKQTATLRSITEALPSLVAVVGPDERYQFVNSAFERWHRVPREQIVGRTMEDFLGAAEYARSKPMIEKVLSGETITFDKDYPQRAPASHVTIHFTARMAESHAARKPTASSAGPYAASMVAPLAMAL